MEKTKWTERKFTFDLPVNWFPVVVERLRGTSARLRDMTSNLTEPETAIRLENKWCIKEHIGHVSDLEELHTGRVDEFVARLPVLRAADMTNAKTYEADHASKSIQKLLNDFSIKRRHYISRLLQLDEETHQFRSRHPRLNKLIRPVDLAYFTAEHDDHHLATIREIMERIRK